MALVSRSSYTTSRRSTLTVRAKAWLMVAQVTRGVWEGWAHRPDELAQAVAHIRAHGVTDDAPEDTGEDEEYEAPEGRILFREHRRYERYRKLVAKKRAAGHCCIKRPHRGATANLAGTVALRLFASAWRWPGGGINNRATAKFGG